MVINFKFIFEFDLLNFPYVQNDAVKFCYFNHRIDFND